MRSRSVTATTSPLASAPLGTSNYSFTVIASEPADSKCQGMPTQSSESCSYDDVDYRPLALVASADGDVRMLLGKHREHGELKAQCPFGAPGPGPIPPPQCSWQGERHQEGSLVIASRDSSGAFTQRTLVAGLDAVEASARVDAQGRIHVAVSAADGKVRYLRLE